MNIENLITKWGQYHNISAAIISIIKLNNNNVIDYVYPASNTNITTNTLFGVGSITKTFVSAAILKLYEKKN